MTGHKNIDRCEARQAVNSPFIFVCNFFVVCVLLQLQLERRVRARVRRSLVVCCATAALRAGRLGCEVNSASDDFKLTCSHEIVLYAGKYANE